MRGITIKNTLNPIRSILNLNVFVCNLVCWCSLFIVRYETLMSPNANTHPTINSIFICNWVQILPTESNAIALNGTISLYICRFLVVVAVVVFEKTNSSRESCCYGNAPTDIYTTRDAINAWHGLASPNQFSKYSTNNKYTWIAYYNPFASESFRSTTATITTTTTEMKNGTALDVRSVAIREMLRNFLRVWLVSKAQTEIAFSCEVDAVQWNLRPFGCRKKWFPWIFHIEMYCTLVCGGYMLRVFQMPFNDFLILFFFDWF